MRVNPPTLDLWLTNHVRALAAAEGHTVDVSNKEPETLQAPLARPLIVLRTDSSTRLDWTTFDCSIAASVLAGTRRYDTHAIELATWLAGILFDNALPDEAGSPVVRVDWDGCNGPYAVTEDHDVSRQYLTAQYVAAGSW
ncbi:hypothetical protein Leucomu_13505 [Leucobacter muris]|uniref:Tail terminator n=1 Tax=Leucobacter muris TaxID=1935379 RepID=A0ABX5QID5_9MICO|nr:hypothetical protein [Leucobacter muris]QAB18790.1 hypothetical protein Leucomu_13505 [Leucobacter muris]